MEKRSQSSYDVCSEARIAEERNAMKQFIAKFATAENSRPLEQRRTSGGNGGGTAAHGPLRMSQPRGPQSQMPKPPGADLPPLAAQGCRDLWDNILPVYFRNHCFEIEAKVIWSFRTGGSARTRRRNVDFVRWRDVGLGPRRHSDACSLQGYRYGRKFSSAKCAAVCVLQPRVTP